MKVLLNDILKVNDPEKGGGDKFSMARVCLLVSVICYFICAVSYLFMSFNPSFISSPEMIKTIMTSLEYPLLLFAGYSFGGKALKTVQDIMDSGSKTFSKVSEQQTVNQ
jgi:hypothetical protein